MQAPSGVCASGLLDGHGRLRSKIKTKMNKHNENNRARRICAKLRNLFHTLKSFDEQIAAVQFNEELNAEQKETLVRKIQQHSAALQSKKNTLEKRKAELAFEDVDPIPAFRSGATNFATHTTVIPERLSDSVRRVRISRRQCKCYRASVAVAEAYAA